MDELKVLKEHCKQIDKENQILYKEKCELLEELEKYRQLNYENGRTMIRLSSQVANIKNTIEKEIDYLIETCPEECSYLKSAYKSIKNHLQTLY